MTDKKECWVISKIEKKGLITKVKNQTKNHDSSTIEKKRVRAVAIDDGTWERKQHRKPGNGRQKKT